jgi:6-phosphogluconolactonase
MQNLLDSINTSLRQNSTCRIGLSGGTSPRAIYQQLAQQKLPWERIEWILIDERCVPPTDEQSNFRMLSEALFSQIRIKPEGVIVFNTFLSPEQAAKDMQSKLMNLQRARHPLIDILILGYGPDGHIASLFPNTDVLEAKSLVTGAQVPAGSAFPVKNRLTLTYQALLDTEKVFILKPKTPEKEKILNLAQKPDADFHEIPLAKIMKELNWELL